MLDLKVELKRHMGERPTGIAGKTIEVDLGQARIFVDGEFVGYVPDEGQVSITRHGIANEVKAYILSEVERIRGKKSTGLVDVPRLEDANIELVTTGESDEPLT